MNNQSSTIVQRLWNYCNVLRDDGVSYGDYVEQLTYLLFLKMADEQTKPPYKKPSIIPEEYAWPSFQNRDGGDLENHYRKTLVELGKSGGMLGIIFRKAQNRIQDPAKLKRLIALIDEETWMGLAIDIKGEIYEGLLQKNAEDTKSGAGQYFTPRPLIKAMVEVMRPEPGMTVCDPACGTGGFFLAAHDHISNSYNLDRDQKHALRERTFKGWEIVDNTARLCVMNLYLHGIGGASPYGDAASSLTVRAASSGGTPVRGGSTGSDSPVEVNDALISDPGKRFDMVLTNPPFGKKSSVTIVNGEGKADKSALSYERDDFWATTSNKQLNFVQHIATLLEIHGKAAVVVPDNVLFEGGAGEIVRRRLLAGFDVHTLLRLPTGIFYAQGVKANVLFFDKKPGREKPWTDKVWIYDLRTNMHFTLKTNQMGYTDLEDFIRCYNPESRYQRQESERFRAFTYEEIMARDKVSLDIFWLKDESLEDTENLPDPDVLAEEIVSSLQAALLQFENIAEELDEGE